MWIASCVSVWTATICSVLGDSLADLRVGGQVTALFPFDEGFPLGHAVRAEGDVSELGAGIDERAPKPWHSTSTGTPTTFEAAELMRLSIQVRRASSVRRANPATTRTMIHVRGKSTRLPRESIQTMNAAPARHKSPSQCM